jgi:hypothetical protein
MFKKKDRDAIAARLQSFEHDGGDSRRFLAKSQALEDKVESLERELRKSLKRNVASGLLLLIWKETLQMERDQFYSQTSELMAQVRLHRSRNNPSSMNMTQSCSQSSQIRQIFDM